MWGDAYSPAKTRTCLTSQDPGVHKYGACNAADPPPPPPIVMKRVSFAEPTADLESQSSEHPQPKRAKRGTIGVFNDNNAQRFDIAIDDSDIDCEDDQCDDMLCSEIEPRGEKRRLFDNRCAAPHAKIYRIVGKRPG